MSDLKDMKQDVAQEDNKVPAGGVRFRQPDGSLAPQPYVTKEFVIDAIADLKKELEKKLENLEKELGNKVNRPTLT